MTYRSYTSVLSSATPQHKYQPTLLHVGTVSWTWTTALSQTVQDLWCSVRAITNSSYVFSLGLPTTCRSVDQWQTGISHASSRRPSLRSLRNSVEFVRQTRVTLVLPQILQCVHTEPPCSEVCPILLVYESRLSRFHILWSLCNVRSNFT